ncbi:uncharacterized protein L201_008115 [Kwoniella dendrophila CBS 6074]|uniref:Uncharacterized protein n=1 Tax=Kwoniella dendrophila CBS 6074 TaxID=1295534 RepID=A0AAX4K8L6_9TREE
MSEQHTSQTNQSAGSDYWAAARRDNRLKASEGQVPSENKRAFYNPIKTGPRTETYKSNEQLFNEAKASSKAEGAQSEVWGQSSQGGSTSG